MRSLDPVALAIACFDGGARLLQVRQKSNAGGTGALLACIREIVAAGRRVDAKVIVNDRADLALLAQASGVHVGQQDLPASAVRALVGREMLIGVSTHTSEQIEEALNGPADYVAVGPVFSTVTKDTGYAPRGLDLVRLAAGRGKPVVAIGGVTVENLVSVVAAGAASVAIISDLLSDADPEARVRHCLDLLKR
jgi:thiamine-phosphate pyrophosphorylase